MLRSVMDWLGVNWISLVMVVFSLAGGRALSDEIVLRHPRGKAANLARLVLGFYFSLFFYVIFYYLTMFAIQTF